ncbi:MAG: Na+/H+ antiporter NhaA [Acidimicrobiia bacterium]
MTPAPLRRLADVFRHASAGPIALVAATAAAIVWANLASGSYGDLWGAHLTLPGLGHSLTMAEWVNEGLMAVFFFVVGLEIKGEILEGELRDPRKAAVPIAAAIGGMAFPAVIFLIATAGTTVGNGWGIPMATDIAFAVGVYRLVGRRAPSGVGLMLLTLAIVDDLGVIAVIAIFYSQNISIGWLLAAVPIIGALLAIRDRLHHPAWYLIPAVALWIVMLRSGVHATIAGVVLGFLTPMHAQSGRPILRDLEHRITPWTTFLVLPLFALANAGILISGSQVRAAVSNPLAIGIALGLVVGKLAGISTGTWVAIRFGGRLPAGLGRRSVLAIGLLGGIGFTVSLFVAGLAFSGPDLNAAKLAILAASIVAAFAAWMVLRTVPAESDAST